MGVDIDPLSLDDAQDVVREALAIRDIRVGIVEEGVARVMAQMFPAGKGGK